MRDMHPVGPYKDVIQSRSASDPHRMVNLGIRKDSFRAYAEWDLKSAIAQYYAIVQEGMEEARHAFKGLKRPLMLNDDMSADESVVVYSWRSTIDAEWRGSRFDGHPLVIDNPPPNRVFVVLVRDEPENEHDVVGSIEKWNWIREDPAMPHAPVDWQLRYGEKLWSRGE